MAPIGEQVCDGSYIAFVMKKVNGPAQAKLGRGTLAGSNDCASPGHTPAVIRPTPSRQKRACWGPPKIKCNTDFFSLLKGRLIFRRLTASLKRCPDTKLEFFRNL